jgi:hypothetical protein
MGYQTYDPYQGFNRSGQPNMTCIIYINGLIIHLVLKLYLMFQNVFHPLKCLTLILILLSLCQNDPCG